jgi:heme-degrading monooxygenase HmoA
MIVREWRGRASPERRDAYPEHFRAAVVGDLQRVDGFLGGDLVAREHDGAVEFVVLTRWSSMEAIRAFAGPDVDRAVVEPGAVAALTGYDRTVSHYEVVEPVTPARTP